MKFPVLLVGSRLMNTRSSSRYRGSITLIRSEDDKGLLVAICDHRHKLSRTAAQCANRISSKPFRRDLARRYTAGENVEVQP